MDYNSNKPLFFLANTRITRALKWKHRERNRNKNGEITLEWTKRIFIYL